MTPGSTESLADAVRRCSERVIGGELYLRAVEEELTAAGFPRHHARADGDDIITSNSDGGTTRWSRDEAKRLRDKLTDLLGPDA